MNKDILTNDIYALAVDHITADKLAKDHGHRHFTDLVAWQLAAAALKKGPVKRETKFETEKFDLAARAAAAPVILEGMKPDQGVFEELRAASGRKYSRYALYYDTENPWIILLPHLARIKQVCQRLDLKACAELAAGQADQAEADEELAFCMADSIKTEPFLISLLVRVASIHLAIQPIWEGLAEHRWNDAQLAALQERFLAYNFLADLQTPLKAERACGVQTVNMARKQGLGFLDDLSNGQGQWDFDRAVVNAFSKAMPSGWYYREKLNYATIFDAENAGVVDLREKTVSPARSASNLNEFTREVYGGPAASPLRALLRHTMVAGIVLPATQNIVPKIAAAQTATEEAALACALERYRLAKGQYPEQLEALTPEYMTSLPNDVITGQPYKYRRTGDGRFVLYSVGWNEKDDGGTPGKSLFDVTQGDWVWEYPSI